MAVVPKIDLSKIKLVGFDIDGTLTDGSFYELGNGQWSQKLSVRDGVGIKHLQQLGVTVAIITHSRFESAVKRAQMLGIEDAYFGVENKIEILNELVAKYGISADECAYMGDERADLAVLKAAGFSATVFEAEPVVKEVCDFVATRPAGNGAAREFIEIILSAKGI